MGGVNILFRTPPHFLRHGLSVVMVVLAMSTGDVMAQGADDKGVFAGKFVGCRERIDLIDYYAAEADGDRGASGKLISSGKCIQLDGLTYTPLRTGFVTSAVQMELSGEQTVIWARTQALIASPPPGRDSHFNF
jgi:hypothetical protein